MGIRQKDQNNSLEVTMVKKFIRQDDVHSELKKIIRNEMQTFLKEERLCVGGRRDNWQKGSGGALLQVQSISNSSAVIKSDTQWGQSKMLSIYTWLACL